MTSPEGIIDHVIVQHIHPKRGGLQNLCDLTRHRENRENLYYSWLKWSEVFELTSPSEGEKTNEQPTTTYLLTIIKRPEGDADTMILILRRICSLLHLLIHRLFFRVLMFYSLRVFTSFFRLVFACVETHIILVVLSLFDNLDTYITL